MKTVTDSAVQPGSGEKLVEAAVRLLRVGAAQNGAVQSTSHADISHIFLRQFECL